MVDSVRVRFAPSPTGYPHVGNIRTALFNLLFARHHGGCFILRIEDTDVARRVEGAVEAILDSLHWLGLDWDEGPHFQSRSLDIYSEAARGLIEEGYAYPCYCSPQRLEEVRREQRSRREPPGYDRHCRDLSHQEGVQLQSQGVSPVVRFKTPLQGRTFFDDLIRGEVVFENSTLDDFVLLKSDGYPTYHLANIVDDHLMQVSHVLRADEWLSSAPRHLLLYQALDWKPPHFAHLPMILGSDRSKLSKRHGAASVTEYQEKGYLPEALMNFLALLGWSLDDRTEILSREELVRHFSLERVSKTAAIFDHQKLDWMNGVYLRKLSLEEFAQRAEPFLEKDLPQEVERPLSRSYIQQIMPLIQERAKTLADIPALVEFFFVDEIDYDASLPLGKGLSREVAREALEKASKGLQARGDFSAPSLEELLRPMAAELGLKTGEFFGLLRVATTGRTVAPPLFQTMAVLGKDRCLKRIEATLKRL
jgi:glutamyl-tRNA synthetase